LQKDPQIIVEVIPDFVVGFTKLKDGEIDAVVADRWVGCYVLLKIRCNTSIWLMNQSAELFINSFKKRNDLLLADINNALFDVRNDGTYDKIVDKWRGKEIVFKTREQLERQTLYWTIASVSVALIISVVGIAAQAREIRRRRRWRRNSARAGRP
jgi:hypothetical protein